MTLESWSTKILFERDELKKENNELKKDLAFVIVRLRSMLSLCPSICDDDLDRMTTKDYFRLREWRIGDQEESDE